MKKLLLIFNILLLLSSGFSQTTVMTPFLKVFGLLECDSMAVRGMSISSGLTVPTKLVIYDSLRIGYNTTTDQKTPYFRLKGDADSDASAITMAEYSLTLVGAATPANAYWYATSTYNRYWWGTADDYIFKTPTNVAGMLTINANTAGDWSGLKFSGTGFNSTSDKYIDIGTHDFWSPTQFGATSIACRNGNFTINSTAADAEDYSFTLNGDGDSDAGVLAAHAYVESITAAADPANAYFDYTYTSNKFRWGGATDYVSLEPGNTAGMLNIVAASAGNWTGINFSGAGWNDASDNRIYMSASNYWNAGGTLAAYAISSGSTITSTTTITSQNSLTINSTAADGEHTNDLIMNADMDADGSALTADELRVSATPASDPTQGFWSVTSTQSKGLSFNKSLIIGDSTRVEKTAIIKGIITTNDSLINVKGIRTEGISLLKGAVTANTKLVVNDSLRVEKTAIIKGTLTLQSLLKRSVTAGITAATPGAQGDGVLIADVNEISTVGTASDAVTLPSASPGLEIFIINNGANTLEIWPASGDNAGGGVDTAITLAAGSNLTLVSYDVTNWEVK